MLSITATKHPPTNIQIQLIDYTKISITDINIERLVQLECLDFKQDLSVSTGEISNSKVADYHFCKIAIYESGNVYFTGSIHKLYNSLKGIKAPNYTYHTAKQPKRDTKDIYKGFNGNQFDINNILEVKQHLIKLFDCKPQQMKFQNIEFGLNLSTLFNPKQFIKGLILHYGVPFEFRFNNNSAQAKHYQYIVKIYNKAYQYGMDGNVLRVEVKILRAIILKQLDIETFADITEKTLNNAETYLLEKLDEVIYFDYTIRKKELTKRNRSLLKDYARPLYWIETPPNRRDRPKKRLQEFIRNYSDNLLEDIKQNIIQKCVTINRHSKQSKCVTINSLCIELNTTQKQPIKSDEIKTRFCRITGVDISMQKDDSFLLSHTGLKHLIKSDYKTFEKVKRKYLSNQWESASSQIQIKEIAHNIRNYKSNQRIKQRRLYPKHQTLLFEITG